jgi:hypothetical protein
MATVNLRFWDYLNGLLTVGLGRQRASVRALATRIASYAPGTAPDCGAGSTICGPPRSMANTARARRT